MEILGIGPSELIFIIVIALIVLALLVALMIWLIPKVWRTIGHIAQRVQGWFEGSSQRPAP